MISARLLVDPPLRAAENMARDEAILKFRHIPTLRFYRWAKPTLSLGWFQQAEGLPLKDVKKRGGEAVRRPTGGKAILHENELTYSLCAPESGALGRGPRLAMQLIHETFAKELAAQCGISCSIRGTTPLKSDIPGSHWCFEDSSPMDLICKGRKLLGSAARRRNGWVLFHGSLVVSPPRETPDIAGTGKSPDTFALSNALSQAFGLSFSHGEWEREELEEAQTLALRYCDSTHLFRR